MQTFPDTETSFSIKTTSGKSVDGGETPYVQDTTFRPCLVKENNYFNSPRMIGSEINENTSMGGNKSVTFSVQLASTNDSVSPVVDTARASLVAISNKVNNPTESNVNVAALDVKTIFTHATGAFAFASGGRITSTAAGVRAADASIGIGRYITITGATTAGNNGTFLVTNVSDDGTTGTITTNATFTSENSVSGTTVALKELFVDEIAPVGSSSVNKYISRAINLANPSNFFRIRFAANIPNEANVLVYYKTSPVGSTLDLDQINWTLSSPDAILPKVQNGNGTFTDIDYSEEGLPQFDSFAIKIVMQSTNSSAIPRIKDLRIIACA
jgi:hypothetical protein